MERDKILPGVIPEMIHARLVIAVPCGPYDDSMDRQPYATFDTGLSGHFDRNSEANQFVVPFDSEVTAEECALLLTASLGRFLGSKEG